MKISEAEPAIRSLTHIWAKLPENAEFQKSDLSFQVFWNWLSDSNWSYTQFNSRTGARYDAELWFDEETGQMGKR